MSYQVVITLGGLSALAAAQSGGAQVNITSMAFGDAGGANVIPDPAQTALINELHRRAINGIQQDPTNAGRVIVECVIPIDIGGFFVKEVGLFLSDGTLFAVAAYPEVYKPTIEESAGRELYVKMIIAIGNTSSVNLTIDNSTVFVTEERLLAFTPIDEKFSHMSSTDATMDANGDIVSVMLAGGYQIINTFVNGVHTKSELMDTDGITVLMTFNITFTADGIPLVERV